MKWSVFASAALSLRRLVNVATPLTAAFVSVPWSEPLPAPRLTVTVELSPVTVLPNWSSMVTTGWVANAEPAVAPAGCVVTTSLFAAPGATAMPFWAPVIEPVTVSVATTFWVSACLSVTPVEKRWDPLSPATKV